MLIPLGGLDFGFKGAGLASLVTLLSAVLTGNMLDHLMIRMVETDDFVSPRHVGHFCLAIDPNRFAGQAVYDAAMTRYLSDLRSGRSRAGEITMAPGDREWRVEAERKQGGIPIDRETAHFLGFGPRGDVAL